MRLVKCRPFGSPGLEGQHESNEAKRRRRSVGRLIDPKAEMMPVSMDAGAGGIVGRSGFWSAWTARHRRFPSHRQPHFARFRLNGFPGAFVAVLRNGEDGGRRRGPEAAPAGVRLARCSLERRLKERRDEVKRSGHLRLDHRTDR